jgi:hypothetical protein
LSVLADSLTAWIAASSTALLGVLGLGFAIWQWRQSAFRPRFHARIDEHRQAFELRIVNAGRARGTIHRLSVVRSAGRDYRPVRAVLHGETGDRFGPWEIPEHGSMRAIVKVRREDGRFCAGDLLYVEWGAGREDLVEAEPAPLVSFYGLPSILPR